MNRITQISKFNNGDLIRWDSSAGTLQGVVSCIRIAKNAANKMTPWLQLGNVSAVIDGKIHSDVILPGTGLSMFNIQKV